MIRTNTHLSHVQITSIEPVVYFRLHALDQPRDVLGLQIVELHLFGHMLLLELGDELVLHVVE